MALPELLPPAEWARLRELIDEALALPAPERERWIGQLPSSDAALRQRLRSLLAEGGTGLPATLPRVETADFAGTPAVPETIGPYHLLRELGRGGMASVWLAERTDVLQQRQVALKLPHGVWQRDTRAGLAERLAREREILARLEHPNIAHLYDAGVGADGRPWLALEYVQGERIDTLAARRPLPERLGLFIQVVRAVAHAHAQLVVHRDIKPANILVNTEGQVKLLDFGIAKLLEQGVAEATELTQLSGRAFTPQYASPEQLRGEPLSTASDIFSLGIVLHELLTGQHPFAPAGATRAALEHALLHHEARPPSERVADRAGVRALRGDLDTIVGKALKKEPNERYTTAAALADDIERHLAQRPVLARPDSAWYRLQRFVRRNRLACGAAALAFAAVIGGAGAAAWQARAARAEAARAEAVKAYVAGLFTDADPFNTGSAEPTMASLLEAAQARLPTAGAGTAALRVELLEMIGASLIGLSQFERAEHVLAQATQEGRQWLGAGHALTLRARLRQLQIDRHRGNRAAMKATLGELLPQLRQRRQAEPRLLLAALNAGTHLAIDEGRHAEAKQLAQELVALARQALPENDPETANSALLLSSIEHFVGDADSALVAAEEALLVVQQVYGATRPHARVLDARYLHGRALGNAGRFDEAVRELTEVLAQVQALLGHEAPMAGFLAAEVARFELERGQAVSALRHAALALAIVSRTAGPRSYTMAAAQVYLARAQLAVGAAGAAAVTLARAREAMLAARGEGHAQVRDIDVLAAQAQALQGQVRPARRVLQALLPQQREAALPLRFRAVHVAGLLARLDGDPEAARRLQQEALAMLPAHRAHSARRAAAEAELAALPR